MRPMSSTTDISLPRCEGPKLKPFTIHDRKIQFIRLLSDPEYPGHAYVFEALIDAQSYALKVFKFYDETEDVAPLSARVRNLYPLEMLRDHLDPFCNECRAYGRLEEKGLNGKTAAGCHGYIMLPAETERELKRRFNIERWDRPGDEYLAPREKRSPLRATVKDLITYDPPLTEKLVRKMLGDLKRIRRVGVYPTDIVWRNYKGGLLLDMSVAKTKRHFLFEVKPAWQVDFMQSEDLVRFDRMIEESGFPTWERGWRNNDYCKKLRSSARE